MKKTHLTKHDIFFKASMRHLLIAGDCINNNSPNIILRRINPANLTRYPDSFSGYVQEHFAEAIYTTPLLDDEGNETGGDAFLAILVEHKSTADRFLSLQLERYRVEFWEHWRQQGKNSRKKHLPPIWTMVFYHGEKTPYPYSTDMRDLIADPELADLLFNKPYHVVDLNQIPDEELKKQGRAAIFQLLHKHIRERDNWAFLEDLMCNVVKPILPQIEREYLRDILAYLLSRGNISDEKRFTEIMMEALPDYEDEFMTLAQQFMKKGKAEGKAEGIDQNSRQIAARMLAKGQQPDFISEITGLPVAEIYQLNEECAEYALNA